jgi:hypothetical protein
MTTIQQALHIFRKDAWHLRFEIAAVFFLLALLILTGVQTWEELQASGGRLPDVAGTWAVLLIISWSLLIARVVQTEALPGDRHFWLTRPYNRASLIMSKALFIAAFISLPLLVAQATIVSLDGLPLSSNLGGLFWNQVLLSVVLLLPIAAIASLTRNLAQFLPVAVLVGAVLAVPVVERRGYGDLEWIPSLLGGVLGLSIATLILWRQYRLRRSVNTALVATAATAVGLILYASFPQSAAFALQSQLRGAPDGTFALNLDEPEPREGEAGSEAPATTNRYRQLLAFPISVAGASPADLRIESAVLTFRTLSGVRRRARAQVEVVDQRLVHKASVDRTFFEAAKDSPVHLEAELYLTEYGNARSAQVPMDGTPVYIDGPGQCGVVVGFDSRRFLCRAAFRSPQPFLSDGVVPWDGYDPLRETNVASRGRALVFPVVGRSYRLAGEDRDDLAPSVAPRPTVLLVRDPVAYFRFTMEVADVRLGRFAIDVPDDR